MNKQEILQYSKHYKKPVIVEFWAPWCVPCRRMSPALEKAARQFTKSVELMRVNADEHPQAIKDFGIMGIPVLIVISNGQEISRHTGAMDFSQLEILFRAVSNDQEVLIPPTNDQRVLRIGSGLAVALMGYFWGPPVLLYLLGAAIAFSGLYDRCPIFKMLYPRLKTLLNPKSTNTI
jgi:thioredoxin